MGRENATAGQAELKLRLSDDQRSQVCHSQLSDILKGICLGLMAMWLSSL
jgi:hypothetical protein